MPRGRISWVGVAAGLAALLVYCGWAAEARALDIDPGDYVALPDGTDVVLGYARFAHSDRLTLKGSGPIAESRLTSALGIAAWVHYVDVGGFIVNPRVFIPYGGYDGGRVGGVKLADAQGFGDPFTAVTVWLLNRPEENRYFGLSAYVFAPLGGYEAGKPLNMGENRWKGVVQAGLVYGLAPGLTAELVADTTLYGDNGKAGGGTQTLSQRHSYQVQPWLRYDFSPGSVLSLGYSGSFGGVQTLDGVATGFTTDAHAVKLDYRRFVTDTLQLAATLSRDVAGSGGFQEAARLNLRILKMF